ncbi:uncharacterized protein B0H18DRAFT_1124230 [Fomitopsis serialis]|uniref:uncharacterized protein n=1 Tax=Fomitopsis serialis TaxID=139415 RepID=UPI002007C355|nr:uncharacterized protein B0H18DRAFT_1124230 [Neoantrodia serialis]KAH9916432.1 hypothetical protein B0H18DRAFT_1124230 [Neoantrodia serialis]
MFDEDVTVQDLARDIVTARKEVSSTEEEDDFEESFKTATDKLNEGSADGCVRARTLPPTVRRLTVNHDAAHHISTSYA